MNDIIYNILMAILAIWVILFLIGGMIALTVIMVEALREVFRHDT